MTVEAYIKNKDIIEAWANGAEIEMYNGFSWESISGPGWYENHKYRIKPKQTIAEWLAENNSDYVPNWEDEDERKYFIYYCNDDKLWRYCYSYSLKTYKSIHMQKETAEQLINLLNTGEVIEG